MENIKINPVEASPEGHISEIENVPEIVDTPGWGKCLKLHPEGQTIQYDIEYGLIPLARAKEIAEKVESGKMTGDEVIQCAAEWPKSGSTLDSTWNAGYIAKLYKKLNLNE